MLLLDEQTPHGRTSKVAWPNPMGKKTLQFVDLGPSNVGVARQGLESRMVERNGHLTMRGQRQPSATMSCKAPHVLLFHLLFWVGRAAVPLLLVLPTWGRAASLHGQPQRQERRPTRPFTIFWVVRCCPPSSFRCGAIFLLPSPSSFWVAVLSVLWSGAAFPPPS